MQVQDIMTKKVLTVRPETTVREVAEILVSHKISGVPVVEEDGSLVGIVSEGDLMSKEILPSRPQSSASSARSFTITVCANSKTCLAVWRRTRQKRS